MVSSISHDFGRCWHDMSYMFCIRLLGTVDCSNLCKTRPWVSANVSSTLCLKNVPFAVAFDRFCKQTHSSYRASFPFLSVFAAAAASAVHRWELHNPHQMCSYLCDMWCSADTRQLYTLGSSKRDTLTLARLCGATCFQHIRV